MMKDERALGREFRTWFRDQIAVAELTQAGVATDLGVHPSTVTKWCSKRPPLPSYGQLVRMLELFGSLPPSLVLARSAATDGTEGGSEH